MNSIVTHLLLVQNIFIKLYCRRSNYVLLKNIYFNTIIEIQCGCRFVPPLMSNHVTTVL